MGIKNFALVLFSALLYILALPNEWYAYGNPFLGFFALVPYFYVLYSVKSIKSSILYSIVFAFFSTSGVYFWMLFFQDFSLWTLSGVVFAHIIYFFLLGPIIQISTKDESPYLRPFITAGIWVVYEYFKSIGYLALPWGLMAHTSGIFIPFIQISDVTGQLGVSFAIVLVNSVFAQLLCISHEKKSIQDSGILQVSIFTSVIIVSMLTYGFHALSKSEKITAKIDAVLVQQDADSWVSGKEMESIQKGQDLTRSAVGTTGTKPDIIIWSENSFRYPYTENSPRYRTQPKGDPFKNFMAEIQTPLLAGNPYILNYRTFSALNAVTLINPSGDIVDYYGKTHPVPFAENIPFWNIPLVQTFFKKVLGFDSEGWAVGKKKNLFTVETKEGKKVRFGTPICFEDSFPDIARDFFRKGADLLINLSNDSWSKTISGETQHFIAAKFRSIENRRTLVRSTNAGVSGVIDPWGKVHNALPLYVSTTERVIIPVYKTGNFTFYTRFGDWFPIVLLILLTLVRLKRIILENKKGCL